MSVSIVGVDLSKSVFQLSIADTKHHVVDRKRLSRTQFHRFLAQNESARLVMEACGTSHYWARAALSLVNCCFTSDINELEIAAVGKQ